MVLAAAEQEEQQMLDDGGEGAGVKYRVDHSLWACSDCRMSMCCTQRDRLPPAKL